MARTIDITVNMRRDEVLGRLRQRISRERFSFRYGITGDTEFVGSVWTNRFRARLIPTMRNSFAPVLTGRIVPEGDRCRIMARVGVARPVLFFMVAWCCGVVAVTSSLAIRLSGWEKLGAAVFGLLMLAFAAGLITWGRMMARDEEDRLADFLLKAFADAIAHGPGARQAQDPSGSRT